MNRAVIPLAAAATFVAVYQLTPEPSPATPAAEPVAGAVQAPAPVAREAERRPVAVGASERKSGRRQARRRRVAVPAVRPARAFASAPPAAAVHYSGCNEVRAAGLAPLYRGQPGYRPDMDGDDDGIACEPHRRRGR